MALPGILERLIDPKQEKTLWFSFSLCLIGQLVFLIYFMIFRATAIAILLLALVVFSLGVLYTRDKVGASACGGAQFIFCAYLFTLLVSGSLLHTQRASSSLEKSLLLFTTITCTFTSAIATASGLMIAFSKRQENCPNSNAIEEREPPRECQRAEVGIVLAESADAPTDAPLNQPRTIGEQKSCEKVQLPTLQTMKNPKLISTVGDPSRIGTANSWNPQPTHPGGPLRQNARSPLEDWTEEEEGDGEVEEESEGAVVVVSGLEFGSNENEEERGKDSCCSLSGERVGSLENKKNGENITDSTEDEEKPVGVRMFEMVNQRIDLLKENRIDIFDTV